MNQERIARLEALGFQWDRMQQQGCLRPRHIISNDSEVTTRKSRCLAKDDRRAPTLSSVPQHEDEETSSPLDPAPAGRDSFNWCARASLAYSLTSHVGCGEGNSEKGCDMRVAEATTVSVTMTNTLSPCLESADGTPMPPRRQQRRRRRPSANDTTSQKSPRLTKDSPIMN
jgi:hypothetical protein